MAVDACDSHPSLSCHFIQEMRDEAEQLNVEAAEYSDLASQLAKKMEKKWW